MYVMELTLRSSPYAYGWVWGLRWWWILISHLAIVEQTDEEYRNRFLRKPTSHVDFSSVIAITRHLEVHSLLVFLPCFERSGRFRCAGSFFAVEEGCGTVNGRRVQVLDMCKSAIKAFMREKRCSSFGARGSHFELCNNFETSFTMKLINHC